MDSSARLVAVDYGLRRVGLAVADPLRLFAQPFGTFAPEAVTQVLRDLHRDEGIELLLVGWPLTPDGEEGEATAFVQRFIDGIRDALPDVPLEKRDEFYTSFLAEEAIRASGARRKSRRNKARVDAAAAAIILQEYLDGL